jgi:hypothetical protein
MSLKIYGDNQCWICGSIGKLTREHKFKASALKEHYGSSPRPLFVVKGGLEAIDAKEAQSLQSKRLKFGPSICERCNSHTSQASDHAFDSFRNRLTELGNNQSAVERIWQTVEFKEGTKNYLDVFRYFAKLLGCHLHEANYPIPLRLSRFVGRQSDINCLWLEAKLDGDYEEVCLLTGPNDPAPYAAQGGLVVICKKPKLIPVAMSSSVSFGPIQFAFQYRWTLLERLIMRFRFPDFLSECVSEAKNAIKVPMTNRELRSVGLK